MEGTPVMSIPEVDRTGSAPPHLRVFTRAQTKSTSSCNSTCSDAFLPSLLAKSPASQRAPALQTPASVPHAVVKSAKQCTTAMTAFVAASAWVGGSNQTVLRCNCRSSARVARRTRVFKMMADTEEEPSEPMITTESSTPPEPYPGFYNDMTRMGLSEEEAQAQARKQSKQSAPVKSKKVGGAKSLLKPDGTPYAPWMTNVSTEYDKSVIKSRTDATGKLASDPQSGELSGVGITWKMLGDELELKWATGGEEGNQGFVVYRRPGKSDEWEKVSDYRDKPAELQSKGPEGASYSFIVPDPSPGSWVYRVSDVDENKNVSDLSQVLVEIESAEDSKVQMIALTVLLAVLGIAFAAGLSLDPLSN